MIKSRCTECGAATVDGILNHAYKCTAATPPTITTESRMPAIELTFDSKAEQQAFMDKLAEGSDLKPSDPDSPSGPSESPNPMIRSEIEKILDECIDLEPYENAKKYAQQSLEALITKSNQELLDRVERELPEKTMGAQLNITVQSTAFLTLSPKELIKNRQLQGEGWDMALDQTKATIDRIRGEL